MSSGKVLLGVLAGVAAGALAGILFAPDKGSKTRKKIYDKGDDYVEELKDKFNDHLNDFLESITSKFEAAKSDADDIIEKGKSKAHALKGEFKNTVREKIEQHL